MGCYWLIALTFLAAASLAQPATAVPVQWSIASGGNGHYYDVIDSGYNIPWPTAESQAAAMSFAGLPGHLATVTSQQENDFIANTFGDLIRGTWLGGFQPPGSPEPAGGWQWITGEPFVYTNWEPGEPNNSGGNEDAMDFATASIRAPGVWNDLNGESPPATFVHGYVVEFERVPEPATLVLAVIGWCGTAGMHTASRLETTDAAGG